MSGQAEPAIAALDLEAHLEQDRETYLAGIDACMAALEAGETYEVCLTNRVRLPAVEDPFDFYLWQRSRNPAPYSAFLRYGDLAVASSSPERFLTVDADGWAECRPIKGTAPRSADPAQDQLVAKALAEDEKTRAENLMIVDLIRNDLGRVSEPGTVQVPQLMAVESYQTVHQLVTTVRGRLRADVDAIDAVRACFPPGSMTGAPKIRTMELLDELEWSARGVYSGALGYLTVDGRADLSVVIRTAVMTPDGTVVGAGGAIVLDSDPVAEYDEMVLKATATIQGRMA
jgi:aminodeoxychorismate synthase component I